MITSLNFVFSHVMSLGTFPKLGQLALQPRKTNILDTAYLEPKLETGSIWSNRTELGIARCVSVLAGAGSESTCKSLQHEPLSSHFPPNATAFHPCACTTKAGAPSPSQCCCGLFRKDMLDLALFCFPKD